MLDMNQDKESVSAGPDEGCCNLLILTDPYYYRCCYFFKGPQIVGWFSRVEQGHMAGNIIS